MWTIVAIIAGTLLLGGIRTAMLWESSSDDL